MSDAVFVFSGTGNSLQIAEETAGRLGCDVLDMIEDGGRASGYDRIGLVFPVHYYKAPLPVRRFVAENDLSGKRVWAAMDYGTTPGDALMSTHRLLGDAGADVLFCVGCRMPENYLMMFSAPPEEECEKMVDAVPAFAERVAAMVTGDVREEPASGIGGRAISAIGGPMYDLWRNTGKFRVTDACTSCGLCAEICPAKVISLESGRPVWTERKCLHCAGCINRCPAEAIQYGRGTEKKRRYVNPRAGF